ncbi:MAG: BREX-4 system phosphatase PglZ [Planctomycetia bacterium]|nr:BREX-4 system phosphatase PglZ [Planctomycetia bacterium]
MTITNLSLTDAKKRIDEYLCADLRYAPSPFFVAVDSPRDYKALYNELLTHMTVIKVTETCGHGVNSVPNNDRLEELIAESDEEKILILGLGDAWALTCDNDAFPNAEAPLRFLKDNTLGKKIVVLALNAYALLEKFSLKDGKFDERRWIHVSANGKEVKHYKATRLDPKLVSGESKTYHNKRLCSGLYGLLKILELGDVGDFYVRTDLPLNLYDTIESAYDLLLKQSKTPIRLEREALDDEHWQALLDSRGRLKEPTSPMSWQAFYTYKSKEKEAINDYHKLVLASSKDEHEYAERLFTALLDVKRNDPKFKELYLQRKEVLAKISAEESVGARAKYLQDLQILDAKERFYYLTDATEEERTLVLALLAQFDAIPPELQYIYPDLARYFSEEELDCGDSQLTAQINDYFLQYRHIKVRGKLTDKFLALVDTQARSERDDRLFCRFHYRNHLLEPYAKEDAPLLWIDALGVEFLPFIIQKAQELKLSADYHIGRAEHPTTTEWNSDFFKDWQSPKKKVKELDELLHDNPSDGNSTSADYLLKELEIITNALRDARNMINGGQPLVVIASDHGASRPVVLNGQEPVYETSGQVYKSGRFCEACDDYPKPDVAVDVEDAKDPNKRLLWVLANYDRFHGGKKGGVEVHGGATLEETLVPVICLTKATPIKQKVDQVDAQLKTKGTGTSALITLQLTQIAKSPTLRFNNHSIAPLPPDPTAPLRVQFDVADVLKNINAGEHTFVLFDEKTKVGTFTVSVESRLGKQQSAASDDFFTFD